MSDKENSNLSKEEELNRFIKRLPWSAFKIGVLFLIPYLILFHGGFSSKQSDWGAFGDFIGGVMGVVIGLLTLMVLGLAYTTQRQELKETRNELKLAREEAARSSEALLMQVKITQYEQNVRELVSSVLQLDKQFTELMDKKFTLPNGKYMNLRLLIANYGGEYFVDSSSLLKEFSEVILVVSDLRDCINCYQKVFYNQPFEVPIPNVTVRYIKRKWRLQIRAFNNWQVIDDVTYSFFENDEWNTEDY